MSTITKSLFIKLIITIVLILVAPLSMAAEATKITQAQLLGHINALQSGTKNSSISDKNKEVIIIDVRTVREFNDGHIPNAINIPHRDILKDISLLDQYATKEMAYIPLPYGSALCII